MLFKKTTFFLSFLIAKVNMGYAMEHDAETSGYEYNFFNKRSSPVKFFLALKKEGSSEYSEEGFFITLNPDNGISVKVSPSACPIKLGVVKINGQLKEVVLFKNKHVFLEKRKKRSRNFLQEK